MTANDERGTACHVDVLIDEHEERTRAKARLSWAGTTLVGIGLARLDPRDEPVTKIGDELAVEPTRGGRARPEPSAVREQSGAEELLRHRGAPLGQYE